MNLRRLLEGHCCQYQDDFTAKLIRQRCGRGLTPAGVVWIGRANPGARQHPCHHSLAKKNGHAQATRTRTLCGLSRSEEHTSELQSRGHLVCRLLLEKKKKKKKKK